MENNLKNFCKEKQSNLIISKIQVKIMCLDILLQIKYKFKISNK